MSKFIKLRQMLKNNPENAFELADKGILTDQDISKYSDYPEQITDYPEQIKHDNFLKTLEERTKEIENELNGRIAPKNENEPIAPNEDDEPKLKTTYTDDPRFKSFKPIPEENRFDEEKQYYAKEYDLLPVEDKRRFRGPKEYARIQKLLRQRKDEY